MFILFRLEETGGGGIFGGKTFILEKSAGKCVDGVAYRSKRGKIGILETV